MDAYLKKWLVKAVRDLKTAEIGLRQTGDDIITDTICFHCQQAVEKLLKAYLVHAGTEFAKTHDLEMLRELCKQSDSAFDGLEIGKLSEYAVSMRYPDDFYIPTVPEARVAMQQAVKVRVFVFERLNVTEESLK